MSRTTILQRRWLAAFTLSLGLGLAGGCNTGGNPNDEDQPENPPSNTYTGPSHFRGTIGSMATIRNYQPMLVSNYGVVVGLDGTGSSEIPEFLRQRLINSLRQQGMGSHRVQAELPEEYREFARMSPEQLLRDESTAIVAVHGFIPPGARRGTRFDLLVSALPQTQTTSLVGGTLFTTDLGVQGVNPSIGFSRPRARGRGPIYVDPFKDRDDDADMAGMRQALVVAGGAATESRNIELVLNQPSYTRAARVRDRINERFPADRGQRERTAEARTDMLIDLNVPERFAGNPAEFLDLIAHLYTQRRADFEPQQAEILARVLEEDPEQESNIMVAWQALGRTAIPTLRNYYEHEQLHLRMAALEAGARLEDERVVRYLRPLAGHEDPDIRIRTTLALRHLPDSVAGSAALRELLDDDERNVRIAAYEALAEMNDPYAIERVPVGDEHGIKFYIDGVQAERPMIYITQRDVPRIAIFNPDLGFRNPMLARLWDNRLMMRLNDGDDALNVYYQRPGQLEGDTYDVPPSVAALTHMLAHQPTRSMPHDGLGMTYGQVVQVLYRLNRDGAIDAPLEADVSQLAELVSQYEDMVGQRPELARAEDGWAPAAEPENLDDPDFFSDDEPAYRGPTDISVPSVGPGEWSGDPSGEPIDPRDQPLPDGMSEPRRIQR